MNPIPLLPALSSSPTAQALVLATASSQLTMKKIVHKMKQRAKTDHDADVKQVVTAHKNAMDELLAEAIKKSV